MSNGRQSTTMSCASTSFMLSFEQARTETWHDSEVNPLRDEKFGEKEWCQEILFEDASTWPFSGHSLLCCSSISASAYSQLARLYSRT